MAGTAQRVFASSCLNIPFDYFNEANFNSKYFDGLNNVRMNECVLSNEVAIGQYGPLSRNPRPNNEH